LKSFGIDPLEHDIRFVEDDWESPTLGAWGLGWEVWLDGMEITQFTYFQQAGGIELNPIPVEITYGIERIAMYLQGVDNVYNLGWTRDVRYGMSITGEKLSFHDIILKKPTWRCSFDFLRCMKKKRRRWLKGTDLPAYDYCLKTSHTFNLLDARGAISVTERVGYILKVRTLARLCAEGYLKQREEMGFPLLNR